MQQQNTGSQQVQPQFTFEGGHLVMFHQEATGLPSTVDSNVNDRDRLIDLLATEKYMTHGYNVSMQEASHDQFFQVLKKNHDACIQVQRQLFNTAFKKGWYRLPVADAQSIATALTQFQKRQGEFPPGQGQQAQTQQSSMAMGGSTSTTQQLNQAVDQAIRQAQMGQVPSGVTNKVGAPVGGRVSH